MLRELVTACRLAASPTTRSPVFVKATTEGVVRLPSEFSKTTGSLPSMTAMQEFVVPKSMPKIFAIKNVLRANKRLPNQANPFSSACAGELYINKQLSKR